MNIYFNYLQILQCVRTPCHKKRKRENALLHILTKVIQKKGKCNEKREFNKL